MTLGIAALVRKLRRRAEPVEPGPAEATIHEPPSPAGAVAEPRAEPPAEPPTEPAAEPDPADELRQKLAESRDEPEATQEPQPPSDPSVDERRAEVYEQGRSTIDEMREPDQR